MAIARALSCRPSLLLADEPTGALDQHTGLQVMELFHDLHREGNTIVLITHDNGIAAQAPRVLRLSDGRLVDDCSGRQFRERLRALETEEAQA